MKQLYLILALVALLGPVRAQSDSVSVWIQEGMRLYNQKAYRSALLPLEKARKSAPRHALANYELALCHFSLGEYTQALEYSEWVLDIGTEYQKDAYLVKGSALDNLGRSQEAREVYLRAIAAYPGDYLLRYNLALTCYNSGDPDCAEQSVVSALSLNPSHASSHLLLGYLMNDRARRVPSVLALYYFLSLEPQGSRAAQAFALLQQELEQGVAKTTTRKITLSLPAESRGDDFAEADLMLSMLAASGNLEANKGKSEVQLFAENTQTFFQILAEKYPAGRQSGWAALYLRFFSALTLSGHSEAFCYWISQQSGDAQVLQWLARNKGKVDQMKAWMGKSR